MAEEDDYRIEVLIALRKLERLDKEDYNEDERTEAEEIAETRKAEEQNFEVIIISSVLRKSVASGKELVSSEKKKMLIFYLFLHENIIMLWYSLVAPLCSASNE